MSERLDNLKAKFKDKIDSRKPATNKSERNFHPTFNDMGVMEIGEEIQDDVWNIVRVPGDLLLRD